MADQARLAGPVEAGDEQLALVAEFVNVYPDADARHLINWLAGTANQFPRISSSSVSALSSFVFSARASALTRICLALASIRFSPAESPRSRSRRQRSLTTSATLLTSPEASFSRFVLYLRDQLVRSSV